MPVPRSPPWPRFLSPLPEPAVRLSRNGLSSGTMPLAHGSIRRREWRNDFRRPHLAPLPLLPVRCRSRRQAGPRLAAAARSPPLPRGPTVVPLRFRMRWFQRFQTGVLGHPGVLRSFPHPSSPEAPSLHRNYPASPVLRASPPPRRPRLTLTGSRLTRATPPAGLPVLPHEVADSAISHGRLLEDAFTAEGRRPDDRRSSLSCEGPRRSCAGQNETWWRGRPLSFEFP